MTATDKQNELIRVLAERGIKATFNGRFLNGVATIKKANGRSQKQRFGIAFDDPATLEGPRVTRAIKGTYAESFARDAFFEAIRIGQGDAAAAKFCDECQRSGLYSGAPQEWIDQHNLESV